MWLWGLLPAASASARPTWQVHSRKSILLRSTCGACWMHLLRLTWVMYRKQHIVFCPLHLPSNWIHSPCWSLFSDLCLKEHPHIIKQIFLGQIFLSRQSVKYFSSWISKLDSLDIWTASPRPPEELLLVLGDLARTYKLIITWEKIFGPWPSTLQYPVFYHIWYMIYLGVKISGQRNPNDNTEIIRLF